MLHDERAPGRQQAQGPSRDEAGDGGPVGAAPVERPGGVGQRLGLVAGRRQVRGEVMQEFDPIRQVVSVYSRKELVDAHELRRSGDRLIVSFEVVHADG